MPPFLPPRKYTCSFCRAGQEDRDVGHSATLDALQSGASEGCVRCAIWREGVNTLVPAEQQSVADRVWISENLLPVIIYEPPQGKQIILDLPGNPTSYEDRRIFLEIFTNSENVDPIPGLTRLAVPPGDTGSDASFGTLCDWLKWCTSSHSQCVNAVPPLLPTRVLEIIPEAGSFIVKLFNPQTAFYGDYVCLSHCWGDIRPTCLTTKASIQQNMERVPWNILPKTFQDAVILTHRLGLKYLWIDSMCIIQDDINDWETESSKMADIYQQSFLTIAATSASNDEGGLFFREDAQYASHIIHLPNNELSSAQIFVRRLRVHLEPYPENPLLKRGWTFQEQLLSPRTVHFAKTELLWQCKEMQICECATERPFDWPFGSQYHELNNEEIPWRRIIQEYSRRNLSFESDKLPALSGVAKTTKEWKVKQCYLAGLWEENLIQDLLWRAEPHSSRQTEWRAPTWSWASINGIIAFDCSNPPQVQHTTVRSAECKIWSDPTGRVKSGIIVLHGPIVKVTLSPGGHIFRCLDELPAAVGDNELGFHPDYDFDQETEHQIRPGTTLYCLRMFTSHVPSYGPCDFCLILFPLGNVYKRIGMISDRRVFQRGEINLLFEDVLSQDVTII